jgi:hypothetical protein
MASLKNINVFAFRGGGTVDKGFSRIKAIEERVGVKIKPFPDELIKFLPKHTQAEFFNAFVVNNELVFLDELMNSKNPRLERINGQIYLPEKEVDVLTKIANSRKEEIKLVKAGTRNLPDARGFHSGLDDQSKLIDQEIIDLGRTSSQDRIDFQKERGKKQYGQGMSVIPERGQGEIYRIRGLDKEAGEEPLPLSNKYQGKPFRVGEFGDQYTPHEKLSQMQDGSVPTRAAYFQASDSIVYDEDEIESLESPYPNLFPTYKAYVDHHELYHRGPGPGGYGGDRDHAAMEILFRDLEEAIKEKNKNVDR